MDNQLGLELEAQCLMVRINERLRGRFTESVRELQLMVRDGGLVLSGRARSFYAKQQVQHVVMEITDLPIRANEIRVTWPSVGRHAGKRLSEPR